MVVHISPAPPLLLQQVLGSGPDPHLLDDLLVQAGSLILQFAPSSLGKRVTTLRRGGKEHVSRTRLSRREFYSHQICPMSTLSPVHT